MKIRALKRLAGSYGMLDKGDEIDLPNYVANDLIAMGYASAVEKAVAPTDEQVPEAKEQHRPAAGRRKRASG